MKKFFRKLFGKKVTYPSVDNLKLLIIDDDCESIHGALGISEERVEDITRYIDAALQRNKGEIMSSLKEVIDQCVHTNEVCFASQNFAVIMIKQRFDEDRNDMLKQFITDAD
jgi:hypothetical protein